jgi:trk system potassium uptake protein
MRVIIVGCSQLGLALANYLYQKGHLITVIDQDAAAFDFLSIDFQGRLIEGDVLTRGVLNRAEIEKADALAAVTRSDALNAVVAYLAATEYQVKHVVARNFDPRQRPLQDGFGVPVISSTGLGALWIEDLLLNEPLRPVFIDEKLNFSIYQLSVPPAWLGHPLEELLPPDRTKTLSWTREGQHLSLSPQRVLNTGDLIYMSADPEEIEELRKRLNNSLE